MPQKKYSIVTFGCQMNVHDSEKMSGVLSREGYLRAESLKDSDLIIFNTCSVREKAEQKFFSELGRIRVLKRRKPALKIAVAGCIAQQRGDEIFKRASHVDFVFGPQNIHLIDGLVNSECTMTANQDNPDIAVSDLPVLRRPEGRAWVSIMYGCNNYCSYCIVPYTRGKERSRPYQNILKEIKDLPGKGFKEVTLLGQNVNSYRSDIDFPGLLREVDSIDGIERIRFVTSHPKDLSDELTSAMHELDKVCEHIHLPLQSASDSVLRLMNRGYSYGEYRRKVDALRKKVDGISITTDIITGFPGESDEDHEDTLRALKDICFDGIFAFKYSPRPGTAAASMGGRIGDEIKSGRLSEILKLQDGITLKINEKLVDSVREILVEGPSESDKTRLTGRTRTNKIVNFEGSESSIGCLQKVRIVEARRHSLVGKLL